MNTAAAQPLAARFVAGPASPAPDAAREQVLLWLTDAGSAQRDAIAATLEQSPTARAIVEGIAEASPYLFDLLRADAVRAHRVLICDPDRHLADLIGNVASAPAVAADEAELMRLL